MGTRSPSLDGVEVNLDSSKTSSASIDVPSRTKGVILPPAVTDKGLLVCLVASWYLFSYLFNVYLKSWFNHFSEEVSLFPLLFTVFLANTATTAGWTLHASSREGCDPFCSRWICALIKGNQTDFWLLCASGVAGMVATCLVMQHGSIQLVQVARSVGPLCTAFWAYMVLNQSTTGVPLVSLAVTLVSTAVASWDEPSFSLPTFCLITIINTSLAYRNVATKQFIAQCPSASPSLVSTTLLTLTSSLGLVLVTLLWVGSMLLQPHKQAIQQLPSSKLAFGHLLIIGFCNFAYNLSSQLVLARVPVVSHGMLELFKRVFVILTATLMLYGAHWEVHNVLGAVVATVSTALYFYTKHTPSAGGEAFMRVKLHDLHRYDSYDGPCQSPKNSSTSPLAPILSTHRSNCTSVEDAKQVGSEGAHISSSGTPMKLRIARGILLLILLVSLFGFMQGEWIYPWSWTEGSSLYEPSGMFGGSAYSWGVNRTEVFRAGVYQAGFTPYHNTLSRLAHSPKECAKARSVVSEAGTQVNAVQQGPHFMGVWSGWIGRNNLGDEIVHDLFLDLLGAALMERTSRSTTVTVSRNDNSVDKLRASCNFDDMNACDFAVIGGGSTVYVDYVKRTSELISNPRIPVALFGSGYQVGLPSKSISQRYMTMLCNRTLIGGVRGPLTSKYLRKFGRKNTNVVRDSAMLADVVYKGGRTALSKQLDDLGVLHSSGRDVLAGSAVSSPNSTALRRQMVVMTSNQKHAPAFKEAALKLMSFNFVIVLQSLDDESAAEHVKLAAEINSMLPDGRPPVLLHNEHQDYAAVLDLYHRSSGSINSRLHSGVLALASLRPSIYISANPKYFDLMESLELGRLVMDPGGHLYRKMNPAELAGSAVYKLRRVINDKTTFEKGLQEKIEDTLVAYKKIMGDLLLGLERQDPNSYQALLCCSKIHISRSPPSNFLSLFSIHCLYSQPTAEQ